MEILQKYNYNIEKGKPLSSLNKNLDYNECLQLILQIGDQIEILNKNGLGIIFLDLEDITYQENKYFLKKDLEVYKTQNNQIVIDRPFTFTDRMAPELKEIKEIPSMVDYTVAFYNLPKIAIKMIGLKSLEQLNPTKLYYVLKRCSAKDPKFRTFFYL